MTGLERGHGISVDPVHNEVAATSDLASAVYVFTRTADGNVAPLRKIQGDKTQLIYPEAVFIDSVNNELVVNNMGGKSILFFSRTATGNVAPLRVIKGPSTGIVVDYGMFVDAEKDEVYTMSTPPWGKPLDTLTDYERQNSPAILVFNRLSNGDVKPIRRIYGDKTMIGHPLTFAFDVIHKEVLLTAFSTEKGKDAASGITGVGYIPIYDMRASGNVPPKRILRSNSFALPAGIFVSPEHDELGLLEAHENMIMVFPRIW